MSKKPKHKDPLHQLTKAELIKLVEKTQRTVKSLQNTAERINAARTPIVAFDVDQPELGVVHIRQDDQCEQQPAFPWQSAEGS